MCSFDRNRVRLSLLILAASLGIVSISRGQTTPTFTQSSMTNLSWTTALGGADINHDGNFDLIVPHYYEFRIFYGNSAGVFTTVQGYSSIHKATSFAIADVNSDGALDVVSGTNDDTYIFSNIGVHLNSGTGGFSPAAALPNFGLPYGVWVADLSNDSLPDIIVLDRYPGTCNIRTAVNTGNGLFAPNVALPCGNDVLSVTLNDFNNDGLLDLAGVAPINFLSSSGFARVFYGNGFGGFQTPVNVAVGPEPIYITSGDVNHDGSVDLFLAYQHALGTLPHVDARIGSGAGLFTLSYYNQSGLRSNEPTPADMNQDGEVDITVLADVAAPPSTRQIGIHRGNGAGQFNYILANALPADTQNMIIGDSGSDGRPDVFVTNRAASKVFIHKNTTPLPAGIGTFGTGTPGCYGSLGITTNVAPQIGAANFRILVTGAPHESILLGIAGDAANFIGYDPFGVGATFYVDFSLATQIFAFDGSSDVAGTGGFAAPIPNDPGIVGLNITSQIVGLEDIQNGQSCSVSPLSLVTSKAVTFTIQP